MQIQFAGDRKLNGLGLFAPVNTATRNHAVPVGGSGFGGSAGGVGFEAAVGGTVGAAGDVEAVGALVPVFGVTPGDSGFGASVAGSAGTVCTSGPPSE